MAAGQVGASDNMSSIMALDVEPETYIDENFLKLGLALIVCYVGGKPHNIALAIAGPPQMNAAF